MPRVIRSAAECVELLKSKGSKKNKAGMARFGIDTGSAFGVSMPDIREIGKTTEKNHDLALTLWDTGFHEARILAGLVDKPQWVTPDQMESWVKDFNSWDLCDQICGNLFDRTAHAHGKILEWSKREEEYVRRAAYAMIAWRSVHDKRADDGEFLPYLELIGRDAHDGRNFVKKAVNWALRQIGKRSASLHRPALSLAKELAASDDPAKRWVGKDAVKELESEKVKARLGLG